MEQRMMKVPTEAIAVAARHGFSEDAALAACAALSAGNGAMAQFSHLELGGMGQWTRGGMLMIGDMFNDRLKGRVRALFDALAELPAATRAETAPRRKAERWWPEELGSPSSSGAQNGMRYAVFPAQRRLAVERDGRVLLFDTGQHIITGAAQAQGGGSTLRFSGPNGTIDLRDLSEA